MQHCPCNIKHMGTPWGTCGDVCVYTCVFCRYMNDTLVSRFTRNNDGDECFLPLSIRMPSIFGKSRYFGEERIRPTCCMASYIHIASKSEPCKPRET
jgi:hypothetical protein